LVKLGYTRAYVIIALMYERRVDYVHTVRQTVMR
jgi:hypothetical protein